MKQVSKINDNVVDDSLRQYLGELEFLARSIKLVGLLYQQEVPRMKQILKINHIVVDDSLRQYLGDMDPLVRSIELVGLLQPPIVTSDRRLISGKRRIVACMLLGWTRIPVMVADTCEEASQLLFAESHEVSHHLPFKDLEVFETGRFIEKLYTPDAAEGQAAGCEKNQAADRGILLTVAAMVVGLSRRKYQKIIGLLDARSEAGYRLTL